jgi:CRISPR type IV-associated protein Csf3
MYNIPIPIEKEKYIDNANNEDWFYKASLVQFAENPINKKTSYKKRFSENHLDLLNQKSVYIDRGWTKNYDVPIPYVANNFEISFYCCGNKKEIEKILQPPFAIGKHKEKGFGFVKSVEIKKMRKDYSIRNLTCLHRSIPEEYIEAKDLQNYTQNAIKGYFNYRPPYFKIRDTKLCYLPN